MFVKNRRTCVGQKNTRVFEIRAGAFYQLTVQYRGSNLERFRNGERRTGLWGRKPSPRIRSLTPCGPTAPSVGPSPWGNERGDWWSGSMVRIVGFSTVEAEYSSRLGEKIHLSGLYFPPGLYCGREMMMVPNDPKFSNSIKIAFLRVSQATIFTPRFHFILKINPPQFWTGLVSTLTPPKTETFWLPSQYLRLQIRKLFP